MSAVTQRFFFFLICGLVGLSSCQQSKNLGAYTDDGAHATPQHLEPLPEAPNYASVSSWSLFPVQEDTSTVDIFYIHPTLFEGRGLPWVASLKDEELNRLVDDWPIRHQASVFEGLGRVYAPRYRQAHYRSFVLHDSLSGEALDLAYGDVRAAFSYWLEHEDRGNPIVLGGHSQGTWHGRRLLQEFFDGTELGDRLVAAYLPGFGIYEREFASLRPCESAADLGCYCTWMTYNTGYTPDWLLELQADEDFADPVCINPITWTRQEDARSPFSQHMGTRTERFKLKYEEKMTARVHRGMLWLDPPDIFGARLLHRDNWHSGDYNLFWQNIRSNAQMRIEHFSKR